MAHAKRIIEAFKANEIERILLIDDAYDPPGLQDADVGGLADFLVSDDGIAACNDCGVDPDTRELAADAAEGSETDSEDLEAVYGALYRRFHRTGDGRFDPGGGFSILKGSALAVLRPLEALLGACGETVAVKTVGLEGAMECYLENRPQVLFLDYYLSDDVPAEGRVGGYRMTKARRASLELLQRLVESKEIQEVPAIVLMSSQPSRNINQYRYDVGREQILSLRFHFLHKKLVRLDGETVIVDHDAAGALLDTSQGYIFGKQIQQALGQWKMGAESALIDFLAEIRNLEMKDFAYLLRFRLREEGQPFGQYLEWFFGECLKGMIEEKVDWSHSSFSSLDDNNKTEDMIEGAYEGPSDMIARLFHRVRVNGNRGGSSRNYRLGDLYAEVDGDGIRTVITPDCDLVDRDDGPKEKKVLTMVGKLDTFDKKSSSADDFLIRNDGPYSVRWDPKNLETFSINGDGSLDKRDGLEFVGTLRPLYAQEIQRRVLNDLSRVGLPVAPAFGINVPVLVWVRMEAGMEAIEMRDPGVATIIPGRSGGKDGVRILLRRRFVSELIDKLAKIDANGVRNKDRKSLRGALTEDGIDELNQTYLRSGGKIEKRVRGIGFVIGDRADECNSAPWLQIGLNMSGRVVEAMDVGDPFGDMGD